LHFQKSTIPVGDDELEAHKDDLKVEIDALTKTHEKQVIHQSHIDCFLHSIV